MPKALLFTLSVLLNVSIVLPLNSDFMKGSYVFKIIRTELLSVKWLKVLVCSKITFCEKVIIIGLNIILLDNNYTQNISVLETIYR